MQSPEISYRIMSNSHTHADVTFTVVLPVQVKKTRSSCG